MLPLITGKEIMLDVQRVDPRDLFQGQYVALHYNISNFNCSNVEGAGSNCENIYPSSQVYVRLEEKDDIWQAASASVFKPSDGIFVRGRITNHRYLSYQRSVQLQFGIERYFSSPQRAKELGEQLWDRSKTRVLAKVKVDSSGETRLVELVATPVRP
jgi:uncharacterized membrane-anchored protein